MPDEANSTPSDRPRRSSFAGETFANLFGNGLRSRPANDNTAAAQPVPQYPNSIANAAAQAQRRRVSITALGLSGSPNQPNAFGSYNGRRDSYASVNSGSFDESAIEEETTAQSTSATQQASLSRRLSFGARALRDVRSGNNGGVSGQNGSSEGFNWSDNLRTRAERTSSIGQGYQPGVSVPGSGAPLPTHSRSRSIAVMDSPIQEMPKPKEQTRPDHFQERILKGDFYMD